jgi:hypothetical protein
MLKVSMLVVAAVALSGPALACGAHASHTAQSTVTKSGPQTVVKQTAQMPDKK